MIYSSRAVPFSPSLPPTMQTLIPTSITLTPPLLLNKILISSKRSRKQYPVSNYRRKKATCCMWSSDFTGGMRNLRNIERAIKLQSAISNKSVKQFAELIGDEWRYCSAELNLQPWQLTKKAFGMLHSFLVNNNVRLLIKPAEDYGVDIGVEWKFKSPLGSGCNISASHVYQGEIFLRNITNVISALTQMKIVTQKLEEQVLPRIAEKLVPKGVLNEKERIALIYSLLSVVITVAFVIIFKNM